jgi:hypothetical protein
VIYHQKRELSTAQSIEFSLLQIEQNRNSIGIGYHNQHNSKIAEKITGKANPLLFDSQETPREHFGIIPKKNSGEAYLYSLASPFGLQIQQTLQF